MSLTSAQAQAVTARGNVLVVAGAGTGKTRTLVERCVSCLLEESPPVSIDEILMVTFTEAAAAEMRQRIRSRLEEQAKAAPDAGRWREQIALFDTAHIGTLHGFCLRLIREHFYELELDPQVSVLAEEDASLLASETLDDLLEQYYGTEDEVGEAFQRLVQEQGQGSDKVVRQLILKLYRYAQSLPDSAAWIQRQIEIFSQETPVLWGQWLGTALNDWREMWLPALEEARAANGAAAACHEALRSLEPGSSRQQAAEVLARVRAAFESIPRGKKTAWRKPFRQFLNDVAFLAALLPVAGAADPLEEDWRWVRGQMRTLLLAVREFADRFSQAKREMGAADFQDLEQHALRLLWDPSSGKPTSVALQWQRRLRFIFVDEYQDINAAQDQIIQALSRPGEEANRFLVGDVKQSIYRFRLANPYIFQAYAKAWRGAAGRTIPLRENFRSREGILLFVNALFGQVMRPDIGGISYDEAAELRAGDSAKLAGAANAGAAAVAVEFHLRLKGGGGVEPGGEDNDAAQPELVDLEEADKEARLAALRLMELHQAKYPVWDEAARAFRAVRWSDMAILLRSPSGKAESYAKEAAALGLPLLVERGGFYSSTEILDLVSVLQILDNPLQDIPLLAVLRSPLVGLTAEELATIRLTSLKARFWTALSRWHTIQSWERVGRASQTNDQASGNLFAKVDGFVNQYRRWRRLARQSSLSRCLEKILEETYYASWLLTQQRGELRHGNVQRLLALARRFDQFQKQGLYRFLRYVEAQQETEAEPALGSAPGEDVVRLMSIHQSKGLEFPIVVVPDLAKPFNFSDVRAQIILDDVYGLCPQVQPPHTGSSYPSLAYWMACQRQTREMLGEEMRMFYVAATRARDLLVLVATIPERRYDQLPPAPAPPGLLSLLRVRSYVDWLLMCLGRGDLPADAGPGPELTRLMRWRVCRDSELLISDATAPAVEPAAKGRVVDEEAWRSVQQKLAAPYPYLAASREPAKTSVTSLRARGAKEELELVGTPLAWKGRGKAEAPLAAVSPVRGELSATEVGNAHHIFLERVSLDSVESAASLKREAERLQSAGVLNAVQVAALDFDGLAGFWSSDLGRIVLARKEFVRREQAFTVRFPANTLGALAGKGPNPSLESELVIVQGVADLALIEPGGITLVDFKTDRVEKAEVAARAELYFPQLRIYGLALSSIYRRPVLGCWLYFLSAREQVEVPMAASEVGEMSAPIRSR